MKAIALAIAAVGLFASIAYYAAEQKKAEVAMMAACLQNGGGFYVSWNWKPFCEHKEIRRNVPD